MTDLTPDELARLEELHAKATPGELELRAAPNDHEIVLPKSRRNNGLMIAMFSNTWLPECKHNPEYFLTLHKDAAKLIAGCREAERLRAGLEAKVAEWRLPSLGKTPREYVEELQALLNEVKRDA